MKRATFEKLKNIINCVNVKLQYFDKIETSVEFFADQLGKHYLDTLSLKQRAQYTTISITDIISGDKPSETDLEKIAVKFPTTEMRALNMDEMSILTEEFLFTSPDYIAFKASNNIAYT